MSSLRSMSSSAVATSAGAGSMPRRATVPGALDGGGPSPSRPPGSSAAPSTTSTTGTLTPRIRTSAASTSGRCVADRVRCASFGAPRTRAPSRSPTTLTAENIGRANPRRVGSTSGHRATAVATVLDDASPCCGAGRSVADAVPSVAVTGRPVAGSSTLGEGFGDAMSAASAAGRSVRPGVLGAAARSVRPPSPVPLAGALRSLTTRGNGPVASRRIRPPRRARPVVGSTGGGSAAASTTPECTACSSRSIRASTTDGSLCSASWVNCTRATSSSRRGSGA